MTSEELLIALFFTALAVDLFYYLFFFARISLYKSAGKAEFNEGVSVVICARNEAENLLEHLPRIFEQQYKNFEVIIVNDCSVDETEDVLRAFKNKHRNCKIVMLKENDLFIGGKKFALTMGIKAAKNDIILFTDADCIPRSDRWIEGMANAFITGEQQKKGPVEMVIGYGGYQRGKSFLNKLMRFDAFMIGVRSLSFALAGIPYMGVGRNLSYRKSLFLRKKGFASHQHIPFGDDDLFVSENAVKTNTRICLSPQASTESIPKKNINDWIRQKKRHLRTSPFYKFHHQVLLALQPFAQIAFIGLFIVLMILNFNFGLIIGALVLRMSIQILIFHTCMKKMGEKDLLIYSPVLELILLFFYPVVLFKSMMMKNRNKYW